MAGSLQSRHQARRAPPALPARSGGVSLWKYHPSSTSPNEPISGMRLGGIDDRPSRVRAGARECCGSARHRCRCPRPGPSGRSSSASSSNGGEAGGRERLDRLGVDPMRGCDRSAYLPIARFLRGEMRPGGWRRPATAASPPCSTIVPWEPSRPGEKVLGRRSPGACLTH